MSNNKNIIFNINGGAGKNVLATAVVKAIKKNHPDYNIIVLTSYKEIWLYNPNVYRVYNYNNTSYFYSNYIKDNKDVKIFTLEPYSSEDYILKRKHLIEIWCDLCKVQYNGELPELYFNARELEFCERKYSLNEKPIFVIQTNGGFNKEMKISWMRDMPLHTAQKVVDELSKKYRVIHVRREDQPALNKTEVFSGNLRELMVLIKYSRKRLFIDSVCQHISVAINKKSTVLWIRNNPEILGYNVHDNIVTKVNDEHDVFAESILEPYDIQGLVHQCPFSENTELFDVEEILKKLENQ